MRLDLDPRRWARRQAGVIAGLTVMSLAGQVSRFVFHHDRLHGLIHQFDLDSECNIPSWFQGATLLAAAALFELIARIDRREGRADAGRWRILAIGFLVMSLDEVASFHENLRVPARLLRNIPAFRSFSWIYPALVLVALLAIYFWPWLRKLPRHTRSRFLWAGAIYLAGAVGLEAVGGIEAITIGLGNWIYSLTYTTEEVLEMVGVLLLIQTLLEHVRERAPMLEVRIAGRVPRVALESGGASRDLVEPPGPRQAAR
jgi:hypothetical protein